jgi:hypothetical protein
MERPLPASGVIVVANTSNAVRTIRIKAVLPMARVSWRTGFLPQRCKLSLCRTAHGSLPPIRPRPRRPPERKYSPMIVKRVVRTPVWGVPDLDEISTAHVERNNSTMRVDASFHAANEWLQQEGREPTARARPELHALQLLPQAYDDPHDPGNQGPRCRWRGSLDWPSAKTGKSSSRWLVLHYQNGPLPSGRTVPRPEPEPARLACRAGRRSPR